MKQGLEPKGGRRRNDGRNEGQTEGQNEGRAGRGGGRRGGSGRGVPAYEEPIMPPTKAPYSVEVHHRAVIGQLPVEQPTPRYHA